MPTYRTNQRGRTDQGGMTADAAALLASAQRGSPILDSLRTMPEAEEAGQPIGRKQLAEAIDTLTRYKQGKANLEERIVQDELWWELRHWEVIRRERDRH